jgi:hypothetical protein
VNVTVCPPQIGFACDAVIVGVGAGWTITLSEFVCTQPMLFVSVTVTVPLPVPVHIPLS